MRGYLEPSLIAGVCSAVGAFVWALMAERFGSAGAVLGVWAASLAILFTGFVCHKVLDAIFEVARRLKGAPASFDLTERA